MYRKHYNKMSRNATMLYDNISRLLQGLIDNLATKPELFNFTPVDSKHPELKELCNAGNLHLKEVVGATLDSALETLNKIIEEAERHKKTKDAILITASDEAKARSNEIDKLNFKQDCKEKLLPLLIMCYERDIDAIAEVMVTSENNDRVQQASNIARKSVINAANTLEHSANLTKQFAESFEGDNPKRLYSTFPSIFNIVMDKVVEFFNNFNNEVIVVSKEDVDPIWGVGLSASSSPSASVSASSSASVSIITQTSLTSVTEKCKLSVKNQYETVFEKYIMPILNTAIRRSREDTKAFAKKIYSRYKRFSNGIRSRFDHECIDIMSVTTNRMETHSHSSSSSTIITTRTAQKEFDDFANEDALLDFALLQQEQVNNHNPFRTAFSDYDVKNTSALYKPLTDIYQYSTKRQNQKFPRSKNSNANAKKTKRGGKQHNTNKQKKPLRQSRRVK